MADLSNLSECLLKGTFRFLKSLTSPSEDIKGGTLRCAAYDVLVPSGCATDFSTTVEVTYYILKSFRACPPWAGEAEKSACFSHN